MAPAELADDFISYACHKLEQNLAQIVRCARLLSTAQLWQRPNASSNSVANLVLHLTGNVLEWVVAGIGGAWYRRDRPAEFAARGPRPTEEIVGGLESAVRRALEVLGRLRRSELGLARTIQGYQVTAQAAVFHVVEHFSFHTGQIVYATKLLCDVDLSLYDAQGRRLGLADGRP